MAIATRTLWRTFLIGFIVAIAGAFVLLNPTLEFKTVDLLERFSVPIGIAAATALYCELGLMLISVTGLITLGIRHMLRRRA